MQQQSSLINNKFSQWPQTPDSAGILIANAGSAANERRGQKNIMNCFRDRTPSYTRSNSNLTRVNNGAITARPFNNRPEGVLILKEPKARPIKLTLLKSSSTRDLSRLYELDPSSPLTPVTPLSSASTSDINKMTSSSSSNNSSLSSNCCSLQCSRRLEALEHRIEEIEKQLKESKAMASQVEELRKKFENFAKEQQESQIKRKKSSSMRVAKKDSNVGTGQTAVQPSKLVAWMKLSNFWKQRPSIQTLKEQNIYNGE